MIEAKRHLAVLDGVEVHVREWGPPDGETVVAWHGLARTGQDFARFAALAGRFRVLAPDAPGRGLSAWMADPAAGYCFAAYERVALALLDRFRVDGLRWVGTSMGGALGIRLAAGTLRGRISHLVVNDIGPELPAAAVERILDYVGAPPDFGTIAELEAWLRRVYVPFGELDDAEWRAMALTSWRRRDDGRVGLHYDPSIVRQFSDNLADHDLWAPWRSLACPTLVLRGRDSDLLTAELAGRMADANPHAGILEIAGCGHAPALNRPEQVAPVLAFLERS